MPGRTSRRSSSRKRCAARDVWWVDVLLTQLEAKLGLSRPIRLEVLIEEVEGLANAEEIATASPRLDALIFGVGDFSLSQGARVDTNFVPLGEYPGDFWAYARNKVLVAARIAGIDAIDAPYPDYRDLEGYERDARRASLMGYTGKWAIHPTQIPVANKVYSPTAEEIALAERNVAAYRDGEAEGAGCRRRQRRPCRRRPRQDGAGHAGARSADQGRLVS